MSLEGLRELIGRLTTSTYALSSLGLALQAKVRDTGPPSELDGPLAEVLAALDVTTALQEVTAHSARPLLGEIQTALRHGVARLAGPDSLPGWRHQDAATLTAAGDVSVWAPSLALARENVQLAQLEGRIELREQGVQDLTDERTFDLAWLPSAFIPGELIPEALRRLRRALRPGGWLLFATATAGGDPLALALARLRTKEWGATPYSAAEAEGLLADAGFGEIASLPRPPAVVAGFIAGCAPA